MDVYGYGLWIWFLYGLWIWHYGFYVVFIFFSHGFYIWFSYSYFLGLFFLHYDSYGLMLDVFGIIFRWMIFLTDDLWWFSPRMINPLSNIAIEGDPFRPQGFPSHCHVWSLEASWLADKNGMPLTSNQDNLPKKKGKQPKSDIHY